MPGITAIFSDVGGVLGSNGWDHQSRRKAADLFHLDAAEFEERHARLADAFECGKLSLDDYLRQTVFHRERPFTLPEFRDFMFSESQPFPESLALMQEIAASRRYFMATLNNESRELNLCRIERLGLRRCFSVFFSSCFLGVRKPDPGIYRLAIEISQRRPGECLFIDDRAANVEAARQCGMRGIRFQNVGQLRRDLTGEPCGL
ncbi:MAG TPA: HAD family phosphatase [Terriglobia bacterium]|nr:HAD family phosphatase [Terriglobia bacterium]